MVSLRSGNTYEPSAKGTLARTSINKYVDPKSGFKGKTLAAIPNHLQARVFDALLEKRDEAEETIDTFNQRSYAIDVRCQQNPPGSDFDPVTQSAQMWAAGHQLLHDMGAIFIGDIDQEHQRQIANLSMSYEARAKKLFMGCSTWAEQFTSIYGQAKRLARTLAVYACWFAVMLYWHSPQPTAEDIAWSYFVVVTDHMRLLGSLWALCRYRGCGEGLEAMVVSIIASPPHDGFVTNALVVLAVCALVLLLPRLLCRLLDLPFPRWQQHVWAQPHQPISYLQPAFLPEFVISNRDCGWNASRYCISSSGGVRRCEMTQTMAAAVRAGTDDGSNWIDEHDSQADHQFWDREISPGLFLKRLRYLGRLPSVQMPHFTFKLRFPEGSYVRISAVKPTRHVQTLLKDNLTDFDELDLLFVGNSAEQQQWRTLLTFLISDNFDHLP